MDHIYIYSWIIWKLHPAGNSDWKVADAFLFSDKPISMIQWLNQFLKEKQHMSGIILTGQIPHFWTKPTKPKPYYLQYPYGKKIRICL